MANLELEKVIVTINGKTIGLIPSEVKALQTTLDSVVTSKEEITFNTPKTFNGNVTLTFIPKLP